MKPNIKKGLYILAFALMLVCFIYLGAKDYSKDAGKTDGSLFAADYQDVPNSNNFIYASATKLQDTLKKGTGLIFIGTSDSKWSQAYAKYLYEASLEYDIDEILYYDIEKDKFQRNTNYQSLLELIEEYTYTTDEYKSELFTPCLIAVNNGKIIGFNNTTAIMKSDLEPKDFWTLNETFKLKEEVGSYYLAIKR